MSDALREYRERDATARERAISEAITALGGLGVSSNAVVAPDAEASVGAADRAGAPAKAAPARRPAKPRARTVAPITTRHDQAGSGLAIPVQRLRNVGPYNARRLEKLGILTVEDLLRHLPVRHIDYSQLRKVAELRPGEIVTVILSIWDVSATPTRRGLTRIQAIAGDETGTVVASWFRRRDFLGNRVRGRQVVLSGRIEARQGRLEIVDPEIEFLEQADLLNTARLVPVYPSTEGLTQRWLRALVNAAIEMFGDRIGEHIPASVLARENLIGLRQAVRAAHFPETLDALAAARRRLGFDELLRIQIAVVERRRARLAERGAPELRLDEAVKLALAESVPYALTGAQRRVIDEIATDLASGRPMARLLQGDVGSGKTIVAAAAILATATSGYQAILMAPTEILAEQHGRSIAGVLSAEPVRQAFLAARGRPGPETRVLIGATTKKKRDEAYAGLASGAIDALIGTHAVIQETVIPSRLGLAIVDEQHRFGVVQRGALREKGTRPHLLVMTATPIPRTLAQTVYGDLDVSIIDEMPIGRRPIKTRTIDGTQRLDAYAFARQEIERGRQAYVVCPLVAESEKVEAASAIAEFDRLRRDVFPDLRLGLLHGRIKTAEKDATMAAFRDGEIQILVATTVIEVGVDVPNASLMIIEAADRFGLAQLHQLRGRVGRGAEQSYCILISETRSPDAEERLRVIASTTDGFALAEEDLRLRGPGEFLGTRQSGLPELRVASLSDTAAISWTRRVADEMIADDPGLMRPDHRALAGWLASQTAITTIA